MRSKSGHAACTCKELFASNQATWTELPNTIPSVARQALAVVAEMHLIKDHSNAIANRHHDTISFTPAYAVRDQLPVHTVFGDFARLDKFSRGLGLRGLGLCEFLWRLSRLTVYQLVAVLSVTHDDNCSASRSCNEGGHLHFGTRECMRHCGGGLCAMTES